MDAHSYDEGRGHVLVRARIEKKDSRTLVIREIPAGTTTDTLTTSIEEAARRGKIKIKSINDFTSEKVEIEIHFPPEQDLDRATSALYAFTQCQVQIPSRIIVIRSSRPVEMDVPAILRYNTSRLVEILRKELQRNSRRLTEEIHRKTLAHLFVENRIYKEIEACKSAAEVHDAVLKGMRPFRDQLQRDITREDIEQLLGIAIRRISLFDLEKNRKESGRLRKELDEVGQNLSQIVPYTVRYLRALLRKYGSRYPRLTRHATFGEISERELTADELTIHYDREKGYIGYKIGGSPLIPCSPLDRLLLIWRDGRCKVVAPPEKLFVDTNLIYCAILDRDRVLTIVYELDFFTYFKKFTVGKLATNRESRIAPRNSTIRFFSDCNPPRLYVRYRADERTKIRQQKFSLARQPVLARDAKGPVLTANAIEYVEEKKANDWNEKLNGPPGKFIQH